MSYKELCQLYYLRREIQKDQERLADIRAKSRLATSRSDAMRTGKKTDTMERYTADMIDLEEIISAKITQCNHQRNRMERYIADIPDSLLRQIFTLRFINHLSWVQVAIAVGGGNTEEGVRKAVSRYLKKTEEKQQH